MSELDLAGALVAGYLLVVVVTYLVLRSRADDRRSLVAGSLLWPATFIALELGFLDGRLRWNGRPDGDQDG